MVVGVGGLPGAPIGVEGVAGAVREKGMWWKRERKEGGFNLGSLPNKPPGNSRAGYV